MVEAHKRSSGYNSDNDTEHHTEVGLNKSLRSDYSLLKVKCLRVTVMTLVLISCLPRRYGFKDVDSSFIKMLTYYVYTDSSPQFSVL